MSNIWLALIPTFFVIVVGIGVIIYHAMCKPDYHILKIIAFMCMIIAMLVFNIPYFRDMSEGETTVVVAEYVDFQSSSTRIGARKVFFIENGRQFELFVPALGRYAAKLQEGTVYEIEYFNNSKLIKSYKLIE
ncbi:MAG: hypothetical protein J6J55_06290 [Paludibacteraceae bacterium]|nr:hypothetical protein [Paludibacteraceae bacterium]